jgi:undecaprenyl-diphosphatase
MNAVLSYVNASDLRVAFRVRDWAPPRWIRAWMIAATRLGDGWLWALVGLGLVVAGPSQRRVLLAAAAGAAASNLAIVLLKRRFRRPRPCELGAPPAFGVRRPELFAFDEFSFPSGHTLNAFNLTTLLGLQFPVLVPALLLAAASIGASRVVMGLHFLSDVVAGAVIGVAIGSSAYWLLLA